jgi:hypothetical protein
MRFERGSSDRVEPSGRIRCVREPEKPDYHARSESGVFTYEDQHRPSKGELLVNLQLVTITKAARSIGVSTTSLRRWTRQGKIPVVKTFGGRFFWTPEMIAQIRRALGIDSTMENL